MRLKTTLLAGLFAAAPCLAGIEFSDIVKWDLARRADLAAGGLDTAWQNPPGATNWGWTSDGAQVTLTNYTGPDDAVIPDLLDGLPVTGVGSTFQADAVRGRVRSVSGGAYIAFTGHGSFNNCTNLVSVSLRNCTEVGEGAFYQCPALSDVSLPAAAKFGEYAFSECQALTNIALPSARLFYDSAFSDTTNLASVVWNGPPPEAQSCTFYHALKVTNYVANPVASGWGATFPTSGSHQRPVVRLPLYGNGAALTGLTNGLASAALVAAATNGLASVALVAAATNTLVTKAVTNGLASAAGVAAALTNLCTRAEALSVPVTNLYSAGPTTAVALAVSPQIYRINVTNTTRIVFDLAPLEVSARCKTVEAWFKVSATNLSLTLPAATNGVSYLGTWSTATTASNQTHYTVWRAFLDGSVTNLWCTQWVTK